MAKQEKQANSLLLPEDEDYDEANFTTLFLNNMTPKKHIERQGTFEDNHDNWEGDYGLDYEDNNAPDGFLNTLDFNLEGEDVAKPKHQAEVLTVNYAKVDKRVDVKALKQNVWSELCDNDESIEEMKEEKSFQGVLDKLPEKLSANVAHEISVPYCFVCLLHLANEKNLVLTQESMDDIIISQAT